jgi:hypothetical protein
MAENNAWLTADYENYLDFLHTSGAAWDDEDAPPEDSWYDEPFDDTPQQPGDEEDTWEASGNPAIPDLPSEYPYQYTYQYDQELPPLKPGAWSKIRNPPPKLTDGQKVPVIASLP